MAQQALQNGPSQRNSHQWRQVADFLDSQFLASLGLRLCSSSGRCPCFGGPASCAVFDGCDGPIDNFDCVVEESAARNGGGGQAQRDAAGLREALPVGNTGITSELAK